MRRVKWMLVVSIVLVAVAGGQEQKPAEKPKQPEIGSKMPISEVLKRQLKTITDDIVPLAEAMPEDKYNWAPTQGEFKGVRTFAQQMTHVAATNWDMAGTVLGEKPPVETEGPNENGPATLKTKAEIVKYLKDSYDYAKKAADKVTPENATEVIKVGEQGRSTRLALMELVVWHSFDHYGQAVVYLRSNGIVPPASRQ